MNDESSDETVQYKPGTRVWCNVMNWMWWPGQVVDIKDTPLEYQEYVAEKKKNYIAIVYFSTDNTHEIVFNSTKIDVYNSPNKMEWLEKGYSLYEKQLKGHKVKSGIIMDNFLKEAVMAEKDTGGDENIFEQFAKKDEIIHPKVNVRDIFVSSKDLRKRKSIVAHKVQNINSPPGASHIKRISRAPIHGLFFCHDTCGFKKCQFRTFNETDFKNHLKEGRETNKKVFPKANVKSQASSSNSSIRQTPQSSRNIKKTKKPDATKIQIQAELLKDWDEDSDDGDTDKSTKLNTNVEAKTANSSSSSNKIFDFDEDDDMNATNENVAILRRMKGINSIIDNASFCSTNDLETLSKKKESAEIVDDESLMSVDLKKDNQMCVEDMVTSTSDEVDPTKSGLGKIFNRENSSIPNWVTEEKWDTLPNSKFNEAMNASKTSLGNLPDLSSMKFQNTLKPIMPYECDVSLPCEDLEIDIVPEKPEPGYERRVLLVPAAQSPPPDIKSDDELLKMPFIIKMMEKIMSNDTSDIEVTIPGAFLLAKE